MVPVGDRVVCAGEAHALALAADRSLGVERRTWLLAFPSVLVLPALLASAWLVPAFGWGGRRHRWRGRFDVVVESGVD